MLKRIVIALIPLVFTGSSLHACAVCFGGADGNLRLGFTWGVIMLGSLPFLLIAGFIIMIARATRRHNRAP